MDIKTVIKNDNCTFDELMSCFEYVKDNGDIAVIKLDGQRDTGHYTIFISFPENKREIIRFDGNDLRQGMRQVLELYVNGN